MPKQNHRFFVALIAASVSFALMMQSAPLSARPAASPRSARLHRPAPEPPLRPPPTAPERRTSSQGALTREDGEPKPMGEMEPAPPARAPTPPLRGLAASKPVPAIWKTARNLLAQTAAASAGAPPTPSPQRWRGVLMHPAILRRELPPKPPPPMVLAARAAESARSSRRPTEADLLRVAFHNERAVECAKRARGHPDFTPRRQQVTLDETNRLPISPQGVRMVLAIKGLNKADVDMMNVMEWQRWAQAEAKLTASIKYGYTVPPSPLIRDRDLTPRPTSAASSPRTPRSKARPMSARF